MLCVFVLMNPEANGDICIGAAIDIEDKLPVIPAAAGKQIKNILTNTVF